MNNDMVLSWQDIDDMCILLKNKIPQDSIKNIVGLSRGGLIPGVILSHLLGVPLTPIVWQSRDGFLKEINKLRVFDSNTTLVVDDICDTGKTIFEIQEAAPSVKIAVLVNKRHDILLDFHAYSMYNDKRWILFPWENV
jgi:hypoxanthine phosphoribosyltransferase